MEAAHLVVMSDFHMQHTELWEQASRQRAGEPQMQLAEVGQGCGDSCQVLVVLWRHCEAMER